MATVQTWELTLDKFCMVLGSPKRVRMLLALGKAEWLPAQYLAAVAKVSRTGVSQHLRVLREARIVEQGYGRLYRLAPMFRGMLAEGWLDFGLARLRMNLTPPPAPVVPAPPAV
jgi:DNA-binding transcriptional ArsR family regulator